MEFGQITYCKYSTVHVIINWHYFFGIKTIRKPIIFDTLVIVTKQVNNQHLSLSG